MKRSCAFIASALIAFAPCSLSSAPASADGSRGGDGRLAFSLQLRAGAAVGMDRFLRGGVVGLGAGLRAKDLSAALVAESSYDTSLKAFFADAGLAIGLGDGIRLVLAGEIPLGSPELVSGGTRWPISPAKWPNRFAIVAPIARLAGGAGDRPVLLAEAELSYSAYRVEGNGSVAMPAQTGVAGFAAGFRARLCLRLSWEALARRRP